MFRCIHGHVLYCIFFTLYTAVFHCCSENTCWCIFTNGNIYGFAWNWDRTVQSHQPTWHDMSCVWLQWCTGASELRMTLYHQETRMSCGLTQTLTQRGNNQGEAFRDMQILFSERLQKQQHTPVMPRARRTPTAPQPTLPARICITH